MTETATESPVLGEIKITVTKEGVQCDSELPIPEVVFWLECARTLVMDNFLDRGDAPG